MLCRWMMKVNGSKSKVLVFKRVGELTVLSFKMENRFLKQVRCFEESFLKTI